MVKLFSLLLAASAAALALADECASVKGLPVAKPVIIGHRGAAGYLPDHTLEGYTLAIESGVDFIEPDLVSTKDGVLVARHEPNIIATTDVSTRPEFADRKRTETVDGKPEVGFFVCDFTLKEIKTIRAIQPLPERDQSYNGKYEIPTFDEIIELAQSKAKSSGRTVGIYPETKHPTWHRDIGLPLEEKLLAALDKAGWNSADAPVVIQSFETANLKALRNQTKVQLAQLVDASYQDPKTGEQIGVFTPYDWTKANRTGTYLDMMTPAGLKEIATYADIVAPYKRYLVTTIAGNLTGGIARDANGDGNVTDADYYTKENPQYIQDAHAAGLKIHTWTFRDEAYRLALNYSGDPKKEYEEFFALGIDGLFSDNCKTAVPARDAFVKEKTAKCGSSSAAGNSSSSTPAPSSSAVVALQATLGAAVAATVAFVASS